MQKNMYICGILPHPNPKGQHRTTGKAYDLAEQTSHISYSTITMRIITKLAVVLTLVLTVWTTARATDDGGTEAVKTSTVTVIFEPPCDTQ